MNCPAPVEVSVLTDYWLGLLEPEVEETVELHLLGCDICGERLQEVIALAGGLQELGRSGRLSLIVSDRFIERAAEQGLRIREYAPPPGGSVQCTVGADDDLLFGRLVADLSGAQRVDLALCDPHGTERARLADIPFSPTATSVVFQQPIGYAKAAPSETLVARLLARDEAGGERVLGEYTFHHTRTLPGPGAW